MNSHNSKNATLSTAGQSLTRHSTGHSAGQTGDGQTGAGQTGAGQTEAGQTGAGRTAAGRTAAGQTTTQVADESYNEDGTEVGSDTYVQYKIFVN